MTTPSGRGGPRQPERGAPVSGPGPLSQRTDGPQGGQPVRVPTGGGYGEGVELAGLQEGAPLSDSGMDLSSLVGLGEPSADGAPVTAGAELGDGPGTEALGLPDQADEDMQKLITYLPAWEAIANTPGSSAGLRNLVREIKSRIPPGGEF